MKTLKFNATAVQKLVEYTEAAPGHRRLYGQATGPGLWLVNDDDGGIYLASNGLSWTGRRRGRQHRHSLEAKVKAEGQLTRVSWPFGESDAIEFIPLKAVKSDLPGHGKWFVLKLSPEEAEIFGVCSAAKENWAMAAAACLA